MVVRLAPGEGFVSRLRRVPIRWSHSPSLSPAAWGMVQEYSRWPEAFWFYTQDRLSESWAIASIAGVGPLAELNEALTFIDLEQQTSSSSQIKRLSDWLELEAQPGQFSPELEHEVLQAASRAYHMWQLENRLPLLITLLAPGLEIPFVPYADGYFTRKSAYGKICLPTLVPSDPQRLGLGVRRGICTQLAETMSDGAASDWILEASCLLAEPQLDPMLRARFCNGSLHWLTPHDLERYLHEEGDDPDAIERLRIARQQAYWLGSYLVIGGPERLKRCLQWHAPSSIAHNARLLLTMRRITDAAITKVYGVHPEYLFESALAAVCA